MANSFELITKYLPQAVDKYFAAESKSVILENGSKFVDVNFNEAGYVKIADFLLDGLSDYYRTQEMPGPSTPTGYAAYAGNLGDGHRDGFDIGGVSVRWEIFKLQWCRGRQFRIDHISNEETAKIVTGGLIEEFHRLKVIPEVDACRFGVIADSASSTLGNLISETLGTDITATDAATGIIHRFNAAFEWLTDHEVPEEMQVIFVRPAIMTYIRNTQELYKRLSQDEYRSEKGVTFTIEKYEGRPIIEVPSSRFFTNVLTTRNGFEAQSSSKLINYMVCSLKAVVPIRKIEYSKVYGEDLSGLAGFYGTMMNYLLYHGVVIPKNKLIGTYVSIDGSASATSKTNVLAVDVRAGDVQNAWKLQAYYTMPSGMRGQVVFSLADFTVGSQVSITPVEDRSGSVISGTEVWPVDVDGQIVDGTNAAVYFGLVDYRGICIAKTPSTVTLVKHA